MEEKRLFFSEWKFLITDEQELIKLLESHKIALSFSVATCHNSKLIQNNVNWEAFQRRILNVP